MTTKNLLQQLIAVMLFLIPASNAIAQTEDAGLSFSETQKTWTYGGAFEHPALNNPHDLPVTYSSSDSEIAYFNEEGEFTATGWVGQTTITASFAGDNTYAPATASYTLVVTNPNAIFFKDYLDVEDVKNTITTNYKLIEGIKKYSDAVYSIYTKKQSSSNNNFSFVTNTSNKAGFYSSTSGGNLKHISIEWAETGNPENNSNYGLKFYGSNSIISNISAISSKLY